LESPRVCRNVWPAKRQARGDKLLLRRSRLRLAALGSAALLVSLGGAALAQDVTDQCTTDSPGGVKRTSLLADLQAGTLVADANRGELKADDPLPNPQLICAASAAALEPLQSVAISAGQTPSFSAPSQMPVSNVRLSSRYGMRTHPLLGGRRLHKGVDLAGAVGTPVRATGDGVVGHAGWSGGYGLLVSLSHGVEFETRYGHMSRLVVERGQRVRRGDVLGYIGTTGRSTGPHLHYEVRKSGLAVDPLNYSVARSKGHTAKGTLAEVAKKLAR
jgi:murein DD-endopeptidase MepM/ murein hydrolase activator NlpD